MSLPDSYPIFIPLDLCVRAFEKSSHFFDVLKANRYITHIKRLNDATESLERFFERIGLLGNKLGLVLYQLPPSLHKDLDKLSDFLELLPNKPPAVFEFRHESWYADDTFELLRKANAAFCIHDMPGKESPRVVTSRTIYVRFYGTTGRYAGNYPESTLQSWATWLKNQAKDAGRIHAYFNNDVHGHAIKNAQQLRELLGRHQA